MAGETPHPMVRRGVDRVEPLDALRASVLDQALQQQRREPLVLPRIRDRDRDLRLVARRLRGRIPTNADVNFAVRAVGDRHVGHLAAFVGRAKPGEIGLAQLTHAGQEQKMLTVRRQAIEEGRLRARVVRTYRPNGHAGAVAERLYSCVGRCGWHRVSPGCPNPAYASVTVILARNDRDTRMYAGRSRASAAARAWRPAPLSLYSSLRVVPGAARSKAHGVKNDKNDR